jgi:hypothetical protein
MLAKEEGYKKQKVRYIPDGLKAHLIAGRFVLEPGLFRIDSSCLWLKLDIPLYLVEPASLHFSRAYEVRKCLVNFFSTKKSFLLGYICYTWGDSR